MSRWFNGTMEAAKEHADRQFADFKATVAHEDDNFLIIDWRNANGSGNYYVNYFIDKRIGRIAISGDIGSCIACWYSWSNTPEELARYMLDIPYFLSKFQASSDKYTYDSDDVEEDLNAAKEELIENGYDKEEVDSDFEDLKGYLDDSGYCGGCYDSSAREIIEKYNPEWWDGGIFNHLGERIDLRVYLWSIGLYRAFKQLGRIR